MTALRPYVAAALLAAACSGPDAPASPTWADVQPILASNCVRCHGGPTTNGTPDSFRLDVYDDTTLPDGRIIRGAATMAPFIAIRTSPADAARLGFDLMPPTVHMEDWQEQTLCNWGGYDYIDSEQSCARSPEVGEVPALGDGEPNSHLVLLQPLEDSLIDEDHLAIQYEITDPDHDMVRGWLTVGGSAGDCASGRRVGELHSGRDSVVWDIGVEAAGMQRLAACVDDGSGASATEVKLWRYPVVHEDGNTAPRATIIAPGGYPLLHIGNPTDSPVQVLVDVQDPDGDAVFLSWRAVHPVHAPDPAFTDVPAASVGLNPIDWDISGLMPDRGWKLEVTVNNGPGTNSRTATSPNPIRISDGVTPLVHGGPDTTGCPDVPNGSCYETGTSIACIFKDRCRAVCHDAGVVPGLDLELMAPPDTFTRGLLFRRVVELENMPPPSGEQRFHLCDTDRAMIGDWLLGGSP